MHSRELQVELLLGTLLVVFARLLLLGLLQLKLDPDAVVDCEAGCTNESHNGEQDEMANPQQQRKDHQVEADDGLRQVQLVQLDHFLRRQ